MRDNCANHVRPKELLNGTVTGDMGHHLPELQILASQLQSGISTGQQSVILKDIQKSSNEQPHNFRKNLLKKITCNQYSYSEGLARIKII